MSDGLSASESVDKGSPATERLGRLIYPVALVALVLIVFSPVIGYGQIGVDDIPFVLDNPLLGHATLSSLKQHWTEPAFSLYVPVTFTFWWVLALFSSRTPDGLLSPALFHAASVVLHAAATQTAYRIYCRLLKLRAPSLDRSRYFAAALAASVFAMHPLQVETVAWLSEAKDLLGGLLAMMALDAALSYRLGASSRQRMTALGLATLLFALACLAKPGVVAFGVAVLVIHFLLMPPATKRSRALIVVPMLIIGLACSIWTKIVQPSTDLPSPVSLASRPFIVLDTFGFYLTKLLFPLELLPDYSRTPAAALSDGPITVYAAMTLLAVLGISMLHRIRPRFGRWILAGGTAFVCALMPISGLIRFHYQEISTVADHYVYLSMFGVGLATLAITETRLAGPRTALLVLVIVLTARSVPQVWLWRNTETLWRYTLERNPNSWNGYFALANHYLNSDQGAIAEPLARESVRLYPSHSGNRLTLSASLLNQKRPEAAASELRALINRFPDYASAHSNLAFALGMMNDLDGAVREYRIALALDPSLKQAREMLDKTLQYQVALARRAASQPATTASTRPAQP